MVVFCRPWGRRKQGLLCERCGKEILKYHAAMRTVRSCKYYHFDCFKKMQY